LEFLDVTAIDALIRKQASKVIDGKNLNQEEKPLITTILNDIKMKRKGSESSNQITGTPSTYINQNQNTRHEVSEVKPLPVMKDAVVSNFNNQMMSNNNNTPMKPRAFYAMELGPNSMLTPMKEE
jgi:hypothetical protein